ncbi:DUF3867 family protein [Clostridium sp. DL1XJH146]
MSDVIDFNELRNRVTDKDVDKFEQYLYSIFYSVGTSDFDIMKMTEKFNMYKDKNNLTEEKFNNIQKKLMERLAFQYGLSIEDLEKQLGSLGMDTQFMNNIQGKIDIKKIEREFHFLEKFNGKMGKKIVITYNIKNDLNNLEAVLNDGSITLISAGKINLQDPELSDLLVSYKASLEIESININICENKINYQY